jgi:hypothetical protein
LLVPIKPAGYLANGRQEARTVGHNTAWLYRSCYKLFRISRENRDDEREITFRIGGGR